VENHFYDLLVRPRILQGQHVPGIGLNQVYEENTVPQLRHVRQSLLVMATEEA
jgi:2-oxoisovalerate dehydrogenase E1 component beta subunit